MRQLPQSIWDAWSEGGPFIGERAASNAYVTVEVDWYLNAESQNVGDWPVNKRPIRWWQRADGSQEETDLPNVQSISIDRSLESDAATCSISIFNQQMDPNNDPSNVPDLGDPGHFTWSHGMTADSVARWQHTPNEWAGVLIPNALLRTYEGWGGRSKSREDALDDGNVVLTGVWLIDSINISTGGTITIGCRDMAKLVIEQHLFPPLVPLAFPYPISYCYWIYTTQAITALPLPVPAPATPASSGGSVSISYATSSVDAWYGYNYLLHGHRGTDALDGNAETFWLGEGNSAPERPFAVNYWEVDLGGQEVSSFMLWPWQGDYQMYVSVMENGQWVDGGFGLIPYNYTPLIGNQPDVVDTGANIPYVAQYGVPWEEARDYALPRVFHANRIRLTFRNLQYTQWGPWHYRAGIREFTAAVSTSQTASGFSGPQFVQNYWGIANLPTGDGYWTVSRNGVVNNFGDAEHFGDASASNKVFLGITATHSGNGYYLVSDQGEVIAYGDAVHRGDFQTNNLEWCFGLALTHNEQGYWMITNQRILGFGNATSSMPSAPQQAIIASHGGTHVAGHPTGLGGWATTFAGDIISWGVANTFGPSGSHHGDASAIRPTLSGNGYWVLDQFGEVHAYGDATYFGDAAANLDLGSYIYAYDMVPSPGDRGYWILDGSGQIYPRGEATTWGSPAGGTAILRDPGNYKDYADIVKELLLWSGWFLQENLSSDEKPQVFGNIESTGIYSEECLPEDMFDKKPVIDAINALKEIVGYLAYVDEEGGFHFESPNFWAPGNFYMEDGSHTDFIPEIDERTQLIDYAIEFNDSDERSAIIISSEDPTKDFATTITTTYYPNNGYLLRGMTRPAMWINGHFTNVDEQRLMAELIALHIWFKERQGNLTIVANPAIQINDQVRIYERQTSESFIHYVRGIHTNHDLDSGKYTMQITTNWLGDTDNWAIRDGRTVTGTPGQDPSQFFFPASANLGTYLRTKAKSRSMDIVRLQWYENSNPAEFDTSSPPDGAAS